jgi:multidrug efflux pump subunit AcrA (membrane-fusion protein)
MRKKKKKIPLIIGIAAALVIGGGLFFFIQKTKAASGTDVIFTVREELYRNVIDISGNIEAAQQQNLQAAGDGTLEAVYVREGDRVKTGQLLFSLDNSQERFNLANHDFQMDQERINGASARLVLLEKQRDVLIKNIENRRMTARFDGVIGKLTLTEGDYAKAQDIFGYLIDRSYLKAMVEVVETDAARIKIGQKAVLTFPAYPDVPVEAVVISYPAVGRITTRGATVLDTQIRIANPPDEILPGYSFTGEIIAGEDERILLVESASIAYENGRAYVERYPALTASPEKREASGGERPDHPERLPGGAGGAGPESGGMRPAFAGAGPESGGTRPVSGGKGADPGPTERVALEVIPYSRNMVKILSGLNAGDRVKAQRETDESFLPRGRRGRGI